MSPVTSFRHFFRVPRDHQMPPWKLALLELLLLALPVALVVVLRGDGLTTPWWLLGVTGVFAYATGLVAAVLLVTQHQRRLEDGRSEPATPVRLARSRRIAMVGGPAGAVLGTWLSTRDSEVPVVMLLFALLLVVVAGLIRGLMILHGAKPPVRP